MKNPQLFRDRALAKLASPQQLDRTLTVTSAHTWTALACILAAFAALAGWAFAGSISTYATGNALLLSRGGSVVDAVSLGQIRLDSFEVEVGDEVAEGQVVAAGYNDEIGERLAGARSLAAERERALADDTAAIEEEGGIARANDARERLRLEEIQATAEVSVETTQAIFDDNFRLYEAGVVSRATMERSREDMNRARRELLGVMREQDALDAAASQRENNAAARLRESAARLQAARQQERELEILVQANRVRAPAPGRVTEIKAAPGMILSPGQSVLSIRTGGEELEALIYLPPTEGPQVENGMDALVSPINVRQDEFGAIRGVVENLSQFPVSTEGMVAELQNRDLVRLFSEQGAPYSGRVRLLRDPATASGFEWTSPRGSDRALTSGMLATVEVRTEAQRPITLVIPALREFLGI